MAQHLRHRLRPLIAHSTTPSKNPAPPPPTSIHGHAVAAQDYFFTAKFHGRRPAAVKESITYLESHFDLIVAESAGFWDEHHLPTHTGAASS